MKALPDNQGGAGEDGVDGLLTASALMRGKGRERVAIVFTDEDLQMNQSGMKKLGLSSDRMCGRLTKAVACIERCKTGACVVNCYARISRETRRAVNQCKRQFGADSCARFIGGYQLISALASCAQPLADGSAHAVKVGERLRKARVRPYFVVPRVDNVRGQRIQGYDTVAQAAGGEVRSVPLDAAQTGAYTEALHDIADQLSKQYVLRYRPVGDTPAPEIVVGYGHRWRHHRSAPVAGAHAVLAAGESKPGCPIFVAVSKDAIQISDCGPWRTFATPSEAPILDGAALGSRVVLLTEQILYGLNAQTGVVTAMTAQMARHEQILFANGSLWALGRAADGAVLIQRDDALFAAPLAVPGAVTLLPPADPYAPCVLAADARWCWHDQWVKADAQSPPVRTPRRIARIDGLVPALLMLTANGEVQRSLDDGLSWRAVLTDAQAHTLVAQSDGTHCVAGTGLIRCSHNAGLTWSTVGQHDATGETALTTAGADVYLSDAKGLRRLERIVGRDIPASATYFPTDVDQFSPRLRPFLLDLARILREQPTIGLLVEGHADHRGSDAHNDDLALRRAQSVADAITEAGVDASRLQVVSHGSRRPLRQGTSSAALQQNRRVELVMLRPMRRGPRFDDCGRPIAAR